MRIRNVVAVAAGAAVIFGITTIRGVHPATGAARPSGGPTPRWIHEMCKTHAGRWRPAETRCAVLLAFRGSGHQLDALRVADCETGGTFDSRARNPSGAGGVFQVIRRWHPDAPNRFSPPKISLWVRRITHGGVDWGAWVCQP